MIGKLTDAWKVAIQTKKGTTYKTKNLTKFQLVPKFEFKFPINRLSALQEYALTDFLLFGFATAGW
jgi:hypothetical protein